MISTISYVKRFIFRIKTVNQIVSSVEKAIDQLAAVSQDQLNRSNAAHIRAEALYTRAENHRAESEKAIRIAERLSGLVA